MHLYYLSILIIFLSYVYACFSWSPQHDVHFEKREKENNFLFAFV